MSLPLSEQLKINWQAPWLFHLPSYIQQIARSADLKFALNERVEGIKTANNQSLRFVTQESLPSEVAYESFIFSTGSVPTRLNLHDFFNAAIWLTFPKIKVALNKSQAIQINQNGVKNERGKVRDALTLFDENAAILVTSSIKIAQGLKEFNWRDSLVSNRLLWDDPAQTNAETQAVLYPFGHALLEKLTVPRKGICSHTWILVVEPSWFALPLTDRLLDIDTKLAEIITNTLISPRDFTPLPILGVPYYWADNQDKTFYNDAQVFRSGRTRLYSS